MSTDNIDILAVTETFLSDDIMDNDLANSNLAIFRKDCDRHGGGMMIFVRNDIMAVRRLDLDT